MPEQENGQTKEKDGARRDDRHADLSNRQRQSVQIVGCLLLILVEHVSEMNRVVSGNAEGHANHDREVPIDGNPEKPHEAADRHERQ